MLIFLDIDGVMVPAAGWRIPGNLEDGLPMFTQKSVEALNSLLDNETEIILTTSHKSRFSLPEWKQIFERRGVKIRKLSCLQPNPNFRKRKDELLEWFYEHTILDDFIIIDDDSSLHALPQNLKDHWIKTNSLVGLTASETRIVELSK